MPVPVSLAGVDEAGRGPLAGPVVAAAVVLGQGSSISGLGDSKTITPARRKSLAQAIYEQADDWGVGMASVEEIDQYNILQATFLAMERAVRALTHYPELTLVDGNQRPLLGCRVKTVVKGDHRVLAIGAASIIAKVCRDLIMTELETTYPGYGFANHKGYPTREHLAALRTRGVTPVHRTSYKPVKEILALHEK
ncbi:MAG: ribonuclease HII [Arenicellales bacterium]|jgi:ribonuclease HII|nr:ribonuclease HII [Acidiferrobacteraceae bacterium]MDP6123114.1 ribonuclease HII [Arenicellales bacterium]MBT58265.1 ribonuclease HII [Acidiferrobacteraceae bacterium]MDP6289015.1 ribonuclease HII [Arenicellales bacterium]MDP6435565.1 ribonuclease HII [Arenicellales bacterium]|tara:strand:- start:5294 stop:5878 length:585 start_codon:yes stop_codon:yes gene_type:complete